ncbi:MAG: DegV family protein [Alicyclobacillus sp.]|nr:DegV family protein [Alicyclobacillus sp.]
MNIAFVTDSTAYLTAEQAVEFGVTVVPLSVVFGDEVFREGVDLDNETFYAKLRQAATLPTTSQPPVGEFAATFRRLLADHDAVMCLLLSGNLSGTLQSAKTAAASVDGRVIVVDSKIASYGIAGPLLDGVRMAWQGAAPEDIQVYWEQVREAMQARFVIDTLENLRKGGRIGGAAAVVGSLLQIKPILHMVDGRIELYEKVRTHRKAMESILNEFHAAASTVPRLRVGVIHAEREPEAAALMQELQAQYPQHDFAQSELGPVIGTHTGAGLMALIWYPTTV